MVPEAGGVRKIRRRREGIGKRGGVRVIDFYHSPTAPVYPLMVYAKAVREDVSVDAKRALAEFAARLKRSMRQDRGG
jgi:hypothetical protein